MEQKNHTNQHGSGFLLGVIVGVIITLLFTTKRGREIVKELTEKGLEKFSDLEGLLNEMESKEFSEEAKESDYIQPTPVSVPAETPPAPEPAPKLVEAARPVTKVEVVEVKKVMPTVKAKPVAKEEKPVHKAKEEEPEVKVEEKPVEKSPHGRRWFRGLKKKA